MSNGLLELKQRLVHFRVCDLWHPEPREVLEQLHGDDLLQGRVLDVSSGGDRAAMFAVIEVPGIGSPVVVAVDRILGVA